MSSLFGSQFLVWDFVWSALEFFYTFVSKVYRQNVFRSPPINCGSEIWKIKVCSWLIWFYGKLITLVERWALIDKSWYLYDVKIELSIHDVRLQSLDWRVVNYDILICFRIQLVVKLMSFIGSWFTILGLTEYTELRASGFPSWTYCAVFSFSSNPFYHLQFFFHVDNFSNDLLLKKAIVLASLRFKE